MINEELPLCKCGCGERVTHAKNKYVYGHHKRGKPYHERQTQKLCDCGCGELANPGRRFITGHNKGNLRKFKPKPDQKLCECGCGELANTGRRFINGHQNKGRKFSLVWKKNLTKGQKSKPPVSDETKLKLSKLQKERPQTGDDIVDHHIAYDFLRPDALTVKITRKRHGQIHSPKGLGVNQRGYSLID